MYSVARLSCGRWIVRHPRHPGLAWSHAIADWVQHADGESLTGFAVITFNNEQDADDYATESGLYPRRD